MRDAVICLHRIHRQYMQSAIVNLAQVVRDREVQDAVKPSNYPSSRSSRFGYCFGISIQEPFAKGYEYSLGKKVKSRLPGLAGAKPCKRDFTFLPEE